MLGILEQPMTMATADDTIDAHPDWFCSRDIRYAGIADPDTAEPTTFNIRALINELTNRHDVERRGVFPYVSYCAVNAPWNAEVTVGFFSKTVKRGTEDHLTSVFTHAYVGTRERDEAFKQYASSGHSITGKICGNPSCPMGSSWCKLRACPCLQIKYCSETCQRQNWRAYKQEHS